VNLIMEYVGKVSLWQHLQLSEGKTIDEEQARLIFRQVIEGLNYLHAQNIYHRDIKLENILIGERNQVKIIDFGFGISTDPKEMLRVQCGTPKYMAPEILQRQQYHGSPADIWAAGVLE